MAEAFGRESLGSRAGAEEIARRAAERIAAWRAFLERHGLAATTPFADLPVSDKDSYLLASSRADLLADDVWESFSIFASSGSSGQRFYWPQLRQSHRGAVGMLAAYLESTFELSRHRTLAIVGLSLGSWIGGEHFGWLLKNVAFESRHSFAVFTPGNRHDEIIDMVLRVAPRVDRFILFMSPSVIGHLHLRAERRRLELPLDRFRYVVTGESFPETLRNRLNHLPGLAPGEHRIYSIYGSADTGVLGFESRASASLRSLLHGRPEVAARLGFEPPLPHFFHCCAPDAYLETRGDELLVTRWQGIPLVRYNLHDRATLCDWSALQAAAVAALGEAGVGRDDPAATEAGWLAAVRDGARELGDVIAVRGRTDRCLILGGTNLNEFQLDAAVRCPELAEVLTGVYSARVVAGEDRQVLEFDLEIMPDVADDRPTRDRIYAALIAALGREQPEFLEDWRQVYAQWDDDPARRILRMRLFTWPALSDAGVVTDDARIKHRGISG